jgi:hypothetical protein
LARRAIVPAGESFLSTVPLLNLTVDSDQLIPRNLRGVLIDGAAL